jgi:hypothetical protein
MKNRNDLVDARNFDRVVAVLQADPRLSHKEVAKVVGLSARTVKGIASGKIKRPNVVVLERLNTTRRCPNCGHLCTEWPCILCEMAKQVPGKKPVRFANQK